MPYFTAFSFKDSRVRAIYSGRFAFLMPALHSELRKKHAEANRVDAEVKNEAVEELKHASQLARLPIGLALSGWRWLIRQWYLYNSRTAPVSIYYKLRFFWFCSWYPHLESKNEVRWLVLKDILLLLSLIRYFPLSSTVLLLSIPITVPIGFILNRHFTLFAYATDLEAAVEVGSTSYTSTVPPGSKPTLLRRIMGLFQHWNRLSHKDVRANWMRLKFAAEKEMYRRFPDLSVKVAPFPEYDEYICRIAMFSMFWSGRDNFRELDIMVNACIDIENDELWGELLSREETEKVLTNASEFFFLHGN